MHLRGGHFEAGPVNGRVVLAMTALCLAWSTLYVPYHLDSAYLMHRGGERSEAGLVNGPETGPAPGHRL